MYSQRITITQNNDCIMYNIYSYAADDVHLKNDAYIIITLRSHYYFLSLFLLRVNYGRCVPTDLKVVLEG